MKKTAINFLVLLICVLFCGCKQVIVNCADELRLHSWSTETASGMTCTLKFYEDFAEMRVYSSEGELLSSICGTAAVDSTDFYITDTELCKTYAFSYSVYGDRAEIAYNGNMLTFIPDN